MPIPPCARIKAKPDNTSHGTANGAEIYWNGKAVTGVLAGDMLIGQGTSLSVQWLGPKNITSNQYEFNWDAPGVVAGYSDSGSSSELEAFNPASTQDNVHFYWAPQGQNGGAVGETISCDGDIDGNDFSLNTHFDVWTPGWSMRLVGTGKITQTGGGSSYVGLLGLNPPNGVAKAGGYGIIYAGSVTDAGLPQSLNGGAWFYRQLMTPSELTRIPQHQFSLYQTGVEGIDTYNHYPFSSFDPLTGMDGLVDGSTHYFSDIPSTNAEAVEFQFGKAQTVASMRVNDTFQTFIIFTPPGGDSINVPLCVAQWHVTYGLNTINRDVWTFINGQSVGADPSGTPTAKFPQWTYLVTPGNIVKDF